MGYEKAPATRLLAIKCACCGRPLLDVKSATIGMGATCRKRCGLDADMPEETRQEANSLVCLIARERTGEPVVKAIIRLEALGLERVARHLKDALVKISVYVDPRAPRLLVDCPFDERATVHWKRIPGYRAHGKAEASALVPGCKFLWSVPVMQKRALYRLMMSFWPKALGNGPKGLFMVPDPWEVPFG